MQKFMLCVLLVAMSFGLVSAVSAEIIENPKTFNFEPFGEPAIATIGQTFSISAGDDNFLKAVTVYINDKTSDQIIDGPDNIDFAFYLYEWDGAKIIGGTLFASSEITTSNQPPFDTIAYVVDLGGVEVIAGTDYVFFISASEYFDDIVGMGQIGVSGNSYADGKLVYQSNSNDFDVLRTEAWSTPSMSMDMAFVMEFRSPCLGDFDRDGDVDGSDLAVFAADFGRTDCAGDCEGDFDGDGDVDGSDLAVFAADFGRTDCPTSD